MSVEQLASRMGKVRPSPVIAIADRAKAMKAEGHEVIGLAQAELDYRATVLRRISSVYCRPDGWRLIKHRRCVAFDMKRSMAAVA